MSEMFRARAGKASLAMIVCFLSPVVAFGQTYFRPAVNYPAGVSPFSIASGNFNQDGTLDLAVANSESQNVSILLGNGDGTFQPAVNYPEQGTPGTLRAIAVGDFSGNGHSDIIATTFDSPWYLNVLLGNGDGSFQPATSTAMPGNGTPCAALGDFNGDGKLDLVVGLGTSGGLRLLLGKGDGTFQSPIFVGFPGIAIAGSVVTGDFNGDGRLDLAVGSFVFGSNSLEVLLGQGDGTFRPTFNYQQIGPGFASLLTADFNNDGKLDMAFTSLTGEIEILLGNGDGTFQAVKKIPITDPVGLALGDFNNDGKLDLAASSFSGNVVSILWGNGDGTFRVDPVTYAVGAGPRSIVTGDFNGDQRPDLAVVTGSGVNILINNAPDFKITAAPNSMIVKAGQTATTQLTITPIGSLNSSIDLSCSGLPALVNCQFSPATVTPNGAPISSVLQITTARTTQLRDPAQPRGSKFQFASAYGMVSLGLLGVMLGRCRRKKQRVARTSLMVLLFLLAGILMSGCGGGPRISLIDSAAGSNPAAATSSSSQIVITGQAVAGGSTIRQQTVINLTLTQ